MRRQAFNSAASFCNCITGYTGVACNMTSSQAAPAPAPFTSPPTQGCQGGCLHGACRQAVNSAASYCLCSPGFSGVTCNLTSSAAAPSPQPLPVAAPVVQLPASASSSSSDDASFTIPNLFPNWAIALVAVVSGCILVGAAIAAGVYKRVGNRVPGFTRFQDQPSAFDTSAVQLSFK